MPDKASSCGGALYTECSSRSGSGGPLRRGHVAAQYRLSAPNADGKQKRHCAIKLNANGRLDNLLSAIRRTYLHEDMDGPMDVPRAAAGGPQAEGAPEHGAPSLKCGEYGKRVREKVLQI